MNQRWCLSLPHYFGQSESYDSFGNGVRSVEGGIFFFIHSTDDISVLVLVQSCKI
jgi:hypothetical protein